VSLLYEFMFLERAEKPKRRRFVDADVDGELRGSCLSPTRKELQRKQGAVDRLHATTAGFRASVAHSATLPRNCVALLNKERVSRYALRG